MDTHFILKLFYGGIITFPLQFPNLQPYPGYIMTLFWLYYDLNLVL